ncbi:hypothetical protein SHELI_v1c01810 [Spiroplasma helicoides]|uniref:Uncharacterized protein n=1 Tax=Spiroplasma helicoides TaxID=216938 RepID=A0A1B3SJM1_9MOLU|nr:hypothetical protein [Spiroplasma helicoides]AOG60136.1 hypothetical protein SHELI_v1c01810 [Spiroplasma helicoides]
MTPIYTHIIVYLFFVVLSNGAYFLTKFLFINFIDNVKQYFGNSINLNGFPFFIKKEWKQRIIPTLLNIGVIVILYMLYLYFLYKDFEIDDFSNRVIIFLVCSIFIIIIAVAWCLYLFFYNENRVKKIGLYEFEDLTDYFDLLLKQYDFNEIKFLDFKHFKENNKLFKFGEKYFLHFEKLLSSKKYENFDLEVAKNFKNMLLKFTKKFIENNNIFENTYFVFNKVTYDKNNFSSILINNYMFIVFKHKV